MVGVVSSSGIGADLVGSSDGTKTRAISEALKNAARRIRSTKRVIGGGGFKSRRGERVFLVGLVVSFGFFVAIPALFAVVYFGLVASDQYQSEAEFSVRQTSGGFGTTVGFLSALSSGSTDREAKIVENYIKSRTMVEKLQKELDIRSMFSKASIDLISRFDATLPVEDLVEYWEKHVTVSIASVSGIVSVDVRAFSAEDARAINALIIREAERVLNELSLRGRKDSLASSELELQLAQDAVRRTGLDAARLRNQAGLVDPKLQAAAISELLTSLRIQISGLRSREATQLASVDRRSPQMRYLARQIESLQQEISKVEAQLTVTGEAGENAALSSQIGAFEQQDLDREVAQKRYVDASIAYEKARIELENDQMYIASVILPTLPESSEHPRRLWSTLLIISIALVLWGAGVGLAVLVRNHVAA